MSDKTKVPLEPDNYYHIYNHANGKENLFVNEGNFDFFLQRYAHHINPVADTYAYCLMPNHFHLAVRIKSAGELRNLQGFKNLEGLDLVEGLDLIGGFDVEGFVSQQFSNLFNSYSKAFNKQQNRKGSLFNPRFDRKHIDSLDYFKHVIHNIHFNPVHHGFVEDLREWKHSSYEAFFSDSATKLNRNEVIGWFDSKEDYIAFHQQIIDKKMVIDLEYD